MSKIIIVLCGVFFVSPNGIRGTCDVSESIIETLIKDGHAELQRVFDTDAKPCMLEFEILQTNTLQIIRENETSAQIALLPLDDKGLDPHNECGQKIHNFRRTVNNVFDTVHKNCFADPAQKLNEQVEALKKVSDDFEKKLCEFKDQLTGKRCWQQRFIVTHAQGAALTAKIQFDSAVNEARKTCLAVMKILPSCASNHQSIKELMAISEATLKEIRQCVQEKLDNVDKNSIADVNVGNGGLNIELINTPVISG